MIIDTINNLGKYADLNPLFPKVVDFINTHNLNDLPEGIVEIEGKDLFANVCFAKGKTQDEALLETHDKMIDIQIPLELTEGFGYTPRTNLPIADYNENNDITFYQDKPEQFVKVSPGSFVIFFPQDGHAPCVAEADTMKKVIFKIAVIE